MVAFFFFLTLHVVGLQFLNNIIHGGIHQPFIVFRDEILDLTAGGTFLCLYKYFTKNFIATPGAFQLRA